MKRYVRDVFTGELSQVDDDPAAEFDAIRDKFADNYRHFVTKKRCSAYDSAKPWITNTLSVDISQMEQFNADAKRHNTGAYYRPDPRNPLRAQLVCETRGARRRELIRRGGAEGPVVDFDAGYSDPC